jgi:hypothetical protein
MARRYLALLEAGHVWYGLARRADEESWILAAWHVKGQQLDVIPQPARAWHRIL